MRLGWWRPLVAAVAALLVVVVCARSAGATGGWRQVPVPFSEGGVGKVVAISDSEIWILGDRMLRGNGRGWQTVTDTTYTQLYDAVAVPGGRVYGISGGGDTGGAATVQWWDHGNEQTQVIPDVGDLEVRPVAIAATGPDDVWIAEEATSAPGVLPSIGGEAYVAHWDGRRLTQTQVHAYPALTGWALGPEDRVTGVVATSPTDVWVLGFRARWTEAFTPHSFTAHWDGRSWHDVAMPTQGMPSGAVPDEDNLVSSGHRVYLLGEASGMGLSRWDGTRWSPITPPKGYHPTSYGTGDGAGSLWLAGAFGHAPSYLHLHADGTWSHAPLPVDPRAATDRSWAKPVVTSFSRAPGGTRLWASGSTAYFEDLPCDTCGDTRTVDHYRPLLQEYSPTG